MKHVGTRANAKDVATQDQILGAGQSWQDVTASRTTGVTYTNTTSKPIIVSIIGTSRGEGPTACLAINLRGNWVAVSYVNYTGAGNGVQAIVPAGDTYFFFAEGHNVTKYMEYR